MEMDLNSDLGESFGVWKLGDDVRMLDIVTSANVACGFHAGDPAGLLDTLRAAAARGVAVGAHVSYPDRVGFGRRALDISSRDLVADTIYQIGALQALAHAAGTRVRYVKPHGALYNAMAHDTQKTRDVLAAILAVDPRLMLVALAGSPVLRQAREQGVTVVAEAFADRAYGADGTLVPRTHAGAVLDDPQAVATRVLRWLETGHMPTVDGGTVAVQADSICLHGDSPQAVEMARVLHQKLRASGVTLRAFASDAG